MLYPLRRSWLAPMLASDGLLGNARELGWESTAMAATVENGASVQQGSSLPTRASREWQTALIPLTERVELVRNRVKTRAAIVRNELIDYLREGNHRSLDGSEALEERSIFNEVIIQLVQWPTFHEGLAQTLHEIFQDPQESEEVQISAVGHLLSWDSRLTEPWPRGSMDMESVARERDRVWRTIWGLVDHPSEAVQAAALRGLQGRFNKFGPDDIQRFNLAILNIVNKPTASPRIKAHALGIAQERSIKELAPIAEALVVDEDTSLIVRAASLGLLERPDQDRVVDLLTGCRESKSC